MLRILRLTLVLVIACASEARAWELGMGLSAVEEGDDRMRPAVQINMSPQEEWLGKFYYYGRKYGPIIERTVLLSTAYRIDAFKFFGTDFIYGAAGLTLMNEQTELKFKGDRENSSVENSTNLGFNTGVYAEIPIPGPVFARFEMESHLFFAGLNGAILLATGRKNIISFASGVRF